MTRLLGAAALALGAIMLAAPAAAGFTLCNKTPTGASVAIGYLDGAKGWTAQGWWSVAAGDCQAIMAGALAGSTVYLLVDGSRLPPPKSQSGGWFCTDDSGFITRNADYSNASHDLMCEAAGLKTEQFREMKLGTNDATYNLNR